MDVPYINNVVSKWFWDTVRTIKNNKNKKKYLTLRNYLSNFKKKKNNQYYFFICHYVGYFSCGLGSSS